MARAHAERGHEEMARLNLTRTHVQYTIKVRGDALPVRRHTCVLVAQAFLAVQFFYKIDSSPVIPSASCSWGRIKLTTK